MRPVSGKNSSRAPLILWVLCGLIIGSFLVTLINQTGVFKRLLSFQSVNANKVTIIDKLDDKILGSSDFSGPFFTLVEREDGSFSYAIIDKGTIKNDQFIDEVRVTFPNGEIATISENENDSMDIFYTKKGSRESVTIVNKFVGGIRLPDGTLLPVKFINGKTEDGSLKGNFRFLILTEKKQAIGEISSRGTVTKIDLTDSLSSVDSTSLLLMQEMLRLVYELSGQTDVNVLGESTQNGVFPLGINSSVMLARRDLEEGVVRLLSNTSGVLALNSLVSFSPDLEVIFENGVAQLKLSGSTVNGPIGSGETGATGSVGPKGDNGAAGAKGEKGDSGA